jgi:hypothetical protein
MLAAARGTVQELTAIICCGYRLGIVVHFNLHGRLRGAGEPRPLGRNEQHRRMLFSIYSGIGVIMNEHFTSCRNKRPFLALSRFFLVALTLSASNPSLESAIKDSVSAELYRFLQADTSMSAGILFGRMEGTGSAPRLWVEGAISEDNDLRLGCPTSKPLLAYLVLKEGLDLDATIDRWFPEDSGFTQSRSITVKHLLLNSSGIQDYATLVPINPDSVITPANTIDRAYHNHALLFQPGTGFEYSNTNFNMIGRILELSTGDSLQQLFHQYFGAYAPSLRLDDGKGNYPRGYPRIWPYHWSAPGYAGGFIGSAVDAMRVFAFVASTPEFKTMTRWYALNGSTAKEASENLLGLGIFGNSHFAGRAEAVVYKGDMGPCQMILARVSGSIFYISSAHQVGLPRLNELLQRLIDISLH